MRETCRRIKLRARFVIGLVGPLAVTSAAATAQQTPSKQETSASSGPQAIPTSKALTTFVLKLISDGILCPINNLDCEDRDIRWKDFALLASDGNTLHLTSIPFPSLERAKKQFDLAIKGAEKIVRRNVESNSKGEQVGERALGLFPEIKESKPPSGVPHYKLFWMWGAHYWEITGEQLDDVLALEQRLEEEGINAVWGWHPKIPSSPDYDDIVDWDVQSQCTRMLRDFSWILDRWLSFSWPNHP